MHSYACETRSRLGLPWVQNENFGFLGFKPASNFALYAPFIDGSMARDVYVPPHACGTPTEATQRNATSLLAAEIYMHRMRQTADSALSCWRLMATSCRFVYNLSNAVGRWAVGTKYVEVFVVAGRSVASIVRRIACCTEHAAATDR